jgi:hypothetical protein
MKDAENEELPEGEDSATAVVKEGEGATAEGDSAEDASPDENPIASSTEPEAK